MIAKPERAFDPERVMREASTTDREGDQIMDLRPSARARPQRPANVSERSSREGLDALNQRLEALEAENEWLKGGPGGEWPSWQRVRDRFPALRPTGAKIVALLARRGEMSRDAMINALWPGDDGGPADPGNVLKVHILMTRRSLAASGVVIETVWGVGLRMPPASRAAIKTIGSE